MVSYSDLTLENGLRLLLHRDTTTPLVTVNLLYGVGSRDERSDRTGLAHLMEHLMFGGTREYPDFDRVVDDLGGESNAFTNNDYTNYYLTLPAQHLREALHLEADRLRGDWNIDGEYWKALEVQKRMCRRLRRTKCESSSAATTVLAMLRWQSLATSTWSRRRIGCDRHWAA